jgi:hypothetical protein
MVARNLPIGWRLLERKTMDPMTSEERRGGPIALAASIVGWLLSYAGLAAALVFLRAECATGGGSEMQLLGMAFAVIAWTGALLLLALGRRTLSQTGWLGLGHAAAFAPAAVWLAPALRHTTAGGLAVCLAFEDSAVRETWPLPAMLIERIYPVATLAVIAAFAVVGIRALRRGRLAAARGTVATAERAGEPRGRKNLFAITAAVAFLLGGLIAWDRTPQVAEASVPSNDAGPGAAPARADAGASDEERCRSAGWPKELELDGRVVDCHALFCRSIDACEEASLPSGEHLWCGACEAPRFCNPATKRCCSRRSDSGLCQSCKSDEDVLEVVDCGLRWRVVCDGCCVSREPLGEGEPLGLVHLAFGSVILQPDGRAQLVQSEAGNPAITDGTWRKEEKGLVARFEVDTAKADGALIDLPASRTWPTTWSAPRPISAPASTGGSLSA